MSLFHDDKHCSCCGRDGHRRDRDKDKDCRRKDKDRDRCKGAFCGRFWKGISPGTEVKVTVKSGGNDIDGKFVSFNPKTCVLTLADCSGGLDIEYVDCECICHVKIED